MRHLFQFSEEVASFCSNHTKTEGCIALSLRWLPGCSYTNGEISHSSVQFSRSVVSDSLQPHESQHTRPPCPSPTPRVYSNSCPFSRGGHPAISQPSCVIPFSSHLLSFPASGSFQMSRFFASGGQSIGVSASASVLPMKSQG